MLEDEERCKMVKVWVDSLSFAELSTLEFEMEKPSYTYLTMRRFRKEQPETLFVIVMGADSLSNLHHWRCHEELLQNHEIYVYPRDGYPFTPSAFPVLRQYPETKVCLINAPLFPYTSTVIRQILSQGGAVESMLPPVVADYIRTHHLYGS